MEQKLTDRFKEDLKEFQEVTERFYKKEVTVPEYKAFSGGFGSYAQRGGERSMLRLRLAGGEMDMDKLGFIVKSIEEYHIEMIHFTTCQTVQLHNLNKEAVCSLVKKALEHGIITRGGGGDFPRNVMCSPLSGVDREEAFDVLPYAKAAGDYLVGLIGQIKLPRKLKVCFSNRMENEVHATFRDLGFVARRDGKFDVYAAGGLGIQPKMGVCAVEGIEADKVLYCIKTMTDVFTEYGNYENRAKARTRFLQDTLTPEGLVRIFGEKLKENLGKEALDIAVEKNPPKKEGKVTGQAAVLLENRRVVKQKQTGLFAVSYHPAGGRPSVEFITKLYHVLKEMEGVSVRLTPDQGMYVINLNEEETQKILELTPEDQGTAFERSTACIGADVCQVGIGKSQLLLRECMERVRKENFPNGVLPAIHISGCPSSCSAHQTAPLGMRGGKKKTEEGVDFAYAVYENGSEKMGEERFGRELGVVLEKDIPEMLVRLGRAVLEKNMTFQEFQRQYPEQMEEIVKQFV